MGTIAPTYNRGLTSLNLHDFITLMILPIGTSGTNEIQYIKYTSEYILKLQIHQYDVFVTSECIHLYILYIVFLFTPMFLSGESLM